MRRDDSFWICQASPLFLDGCLMPFCPLPARISYLILAEQIPQGSLQLGKAKTIARCEKSRWLHASTGQKQLVGHFSKCQPGSKLGHGKEGGSTQHSTQCLGKF